MININLNENVKVKLTELGIQRLKDIHDAFYKKISEKNGIEFSEGLKEFRLIIDDEGYYKTHLWDLFNTFGDMIGVGLESPFDINIVIDK